MCHPLNCMNISQAACDYLSSREKGTCQECADTHWHGPKYAQRINISRNRLGVYLSLQKASKQATQWQPSLKTSPYAGI